MPPVKYINRSLAYFFYALAIAYILVLLAGINFVALIFLGVAGMFFFLLANETRARTQLLMAWLSIGFVTFMLAEAYALIAMHHENARRSKITYNGSTRVYWDVDTDMGYRASGPRKVHAVKAGDKRPIYDARYTINPDGLRHTASNNSGECAYWFFGGSFTFGEGLTDDETLAHYFSKALDSRFQVINFGFHGYGPHHMLKQIESGYAQRVSHTFPAIAFYTWLPDHVWRSAGLTSWNLYDPRYLRRTDGYVSQNGTFNWPVKHDDTAHPVTSELIAVMRNSGLFRMIYGYPLSEHDEVLENAVNLQADILVTAKQMLESRYNARLIVTAWKDDTDLSDRAIKAMLEKGITVIDKQSLLNREWGEHYTIPGDGHPSKLANLEIASSLARQYGSCEQGQYNLE